MPLGTLRPSPLVDQATRRLRDQITEGHWPVGSKLPGETTLAKSLGVGRSTVREAVRALAGAGLVQARHGSGVFVIATEPTEDWPARLRRAAVADVYEVRMLIEVQAARLAALRHTEADRAALDAALDARRAAAEGDDAAFVDADIALHAAVVTAAHNPVLTDLFAEFVPALRQGLIDLVDLLALRARTPNHGDDSHAALVRAVKEGDAEAAGRVLQAELEQILAWIRDPGAAR
ncbi:MULTISPECIES: FadR/GntR family transcriptional regulator [Streptomyces]|uniref:GntR family transcriptional regulator n=1 Tax=Streptomyces hygroscopicus TaxID=1912 RepID=A0ABQ3U134_STRHY|nr:MULTISPECIES: FCD domain-containing protein [Streptomyces]MBW8092236.1 FadR family transcriptional regulator [Streptomyces hygroscopicus subsp. hygroscopicus]MCO8302136.1 FCD domain-containing protein [Streptomyces sp. RKCA744]MDN3055641.1 FCD domain-containing protein [Streptomyces sp. SRF1]GHJ29097.1 GntR family transcriptional regulator [Streptomyces hygroscopicus]